MADRLVSRQCRWLLGYAQLWQGDLASALAQFGKVITEAEAAHDVIWKMVGLDGQAFALAYRGDPSAAGVVANAVADTAGELGGLYEATSHIVSAVVALAAGDAAALSADAIKAITEWRGGRWRGGRSGFAFEYVYLVAEVALARGELAAAHRWAAEAVSATVGWHQMVALTVRARTAIAEGEFEGAERDAREALARGADLRAHLGIPNILECLAGLAGDAGSHQEAARLFGAAETIREHMGAVRFKIYDAGHEASVAAVRNALGEQDFDSAWAEGAALSTEEAIAYAQRGYGERKRPTSGWASLTPAEHDVVRLVSEGLANNDIATRLFISPRTVQTHLTHVYTKLGLTSRVQLAQEAARHD
jgi:DNA-binding CsgD family transcriptional regulator